MRWKFYNLAFRIFGKTRCWKKLGQMFRTDVVVIKKEVKMPKTIGRCPYCNDPILDFQAFTTRGAQSRFHPVTIIPGKKYHKGCYETLEKEEKKGGV